MHSGSKPTSGLPLTSPIVVQGPGGKWYKSSAGANKTAGAANNPVKSK